MICGGREILFFDSADYVGISQLLVARVNSFPLNKDFDDGIRKNPDEKLQANGQQTLFHLVNDLFKNIDIFVIFHCNMVNSHLWQYQMVCLVNLNNVAMT